MIQELLTVVREQQQIIVSLESALGLQQPQEQAQAALAELQESIRLLLQSRPAQEILKPLQCDAHTDVKTVWPMIESIKGKYCDMPPEGTNRCGLPMHLSNTGCD